MDVASSASDRNSVNDETKFYQAVAADRQDRVQSAIDDQQSNEDRNAWAGILREAFAHAKSKEMAELLIRNGVNIHDRGHHKSTILMEATATPVLQHLIDAGVGLEQIDVEGRTALRRSVELDEDQAKALFLINKTSANINASDNKQRSVLMTAVWKSRKDVLELLLAKNVEVNAQDRKGRVALHHLAADETRTYDYQPNAEPHQQQAIDQDIMERLLNAGNKPAAKDKKGLTCLHWAAANGCSGLLEILLVSGKFNVDVDEENYGAWTPLHHACEAQNDVTSSVKTLLKKRGDVEGADINKKTRNGRTPLHIAARAGNLEIVRVLLAHKKVNRNARDLFGNTPLLSAASLSMDHANREAIVKLFSPWQKCHTLSEEAKRAAQLWNATIVDFSLTKERSRDSTMEGDRKPARNPNAGDKTRNTTQATATRQETSIYELLYERDPEDEDKPAVTVSPSDIPGDGFRWLHIPSNNIAWVQDLFAKYYVEEGTMDANSFKALERSFNQQRGGKLPQ